jgi:hypothetical protein
VFTYLSQRPGQYFDPETIRKESGLKDETNDLQAATRVARDLFNRQLIHRKEDGKNVRYAGKTEDELSGISPTQGGTSTVDASQLGPHAQTLMNSWPPKATVRKAVFAFLSANPNTSFTNNEIFQESGATSNLDVVHGVANALVDMNVVKKFTASYGRTVRYQGKTEAELANVLTPTSGN